MDSADSKDVTRLLRAWSDGDAGALDRLTPIVYDELKRMARRYMRGERAGHLFQTTALVHEAWLRLVKPGLPDDWRDRTHFFAVCATIMRRILVDLARSRTATKRGGRAERLQHSSPIDLDGLPSASVGEELLSLEAALETLARQDARKARVIELRFFGGLSVEETAEALKVSPQTVLRDWNLARAWLVRELRTGG